MTRNPQKEDAEAVPHTPRVFPADLECQLTKVLHVHTSADTVLLFWFYSCDGWLVDSFKVCLYALGGGGEGPGGFFSFLHAFLWSNPAFFQHKSWRVWSEKDLNSCKCGQIWCLQHWPYQSTRPFTTEYKGLTCQFCLSAENTVSTMAGTDQQLC